MTRDEAKTGKLTLERRQGVRLADFVKITGQDYSGFRTMMQRDQLPFDAAPEDGKYRRYDGAACLAMFTAELMVRTLGISWAYAAKRVLFGRSVLTYLSALNRMEQEELYIIHAVELDETGIIEAYIPFDTCTMGLRNLVEYIESGKYISISYLKMSEAYRHAQEGARNAGFKLDGFDLWKITDEELAN